MQEVFPMQIFPEPRIEEKFGEADRTILTLMLESDAKSAHNEQIIDNNEQLNGPGFESLKAH